MDISRLLECFGCLTGDPENIVESVKARNPELVKYLETLTNASFQGETSNILDASTDHNEKCGYRNLGGILFNMDGLIRARGGNFTGNEDEFLEYVEQAAYQRCPKRHSLIRFRKNIMQEKSRFVELYRRRGTGESHPLHHMDYWGTRQQLRSGKVIGDWIDKRNGPLDPIFGALLSPTAGRTGPGDSDLTHTLLFDDSGPIAYHSAVHDAFGYLINFHHTGPGYKYLGSYSIFDAHEPLSDQVSGIEFWSELLRQLKARKSRLRIY